MPLSIRISSEIGAKVKVPPIDVKRKNQMTKKVSRRKAGKGEMLPPKRGTGGTTKKNTEAKTHGATRADLELVQRFREGDLGAFDAIFEAYSGPLLGFLTRMCGNPEDAKEGLQDTFLSVFRYLEGFRGEASLKNWIFKIAVTACLKKKRKMQPFPSGEIEGGPGGWAGPEAFTNPLDASRGSPEWKLDPETLVLDDEFRRYIVQGVASMPYIYKVVINLRDFEGFSTQEVSRLLGLKESTVKVRLHRARLYLQDWLKRRLRVSDEGKPERV
jgi:RNA polymerase sigma-70 factor (ECF subfamily)